MSSHKATVAPFHKEDTTPDWQTKTKNWLDANTGLWVEVAELLTILRGLANAGHNTMYWGMRLTTLLDGMQCLSYNLPDLWD